MGIELNHTIVRAREPARAAGFLSELLGLGAPRPFGPFWIVELANGVSLDFLGAEGGEVASQHYAFLVSEAEFDRIFERIRERRLSYWADPARSRRGEINRHDGGRGVYFEDLSGHLLEILTRPYGAGSTG